MLLIFFFHFLGNLYQSALLTWRILKSKTKKQIFKNIFIVLSFIDPWTNKSHATKEIKNKFGVLKFFQFRNLFLFWISAKFYPWQTCQVYMCLLEWFYGMPSWKWLQADLTGGCFPIYKATFFFYENSRYDISRR